jgi:hypothetical protein
VDDPKFVPLQAQGESPEEGEGLLPDRRRGPEEPVVTLPPQAEECVQLVVTQNALRLARVEEAAQLADDPGAVRPPVSQVADEDEASTLRVAAVRAVAEVLHEGGQGVGLTVNVADDVERAVEKRLDKALHRGLTPVVLAGVTARRNAT